MNTAKSQLAAAALGAAFLVSAGAQATASPNGGYKDLEPAPAVEVVYGPGWLVRFRGVGVVPQESSGNWKVDNLPAFIPLGVPGEDLSISSTLVPEVDFTYFFTPNIAVELIAAVAPHQVDADGVLRNLPLPFAVRDLGQIGSTWILPPTLTLQYHFYLDYGIKPYVGVGVNYTVFFSETSGPFFHDLQLDNNWGWALQAGVDIPLGGNWFLNFDVKKIFLDSSASVRLRPAVLAPFDPGHFVTADLQVDPWLIGVGIGYRFGAMPQPLK